MSERKETETREEAARQHVLDALIACYDRRPHPEARFEAETEA